MYMFYASYSLRMLQYPYTVPDRSLSPPAPRPGSTAPCHRTNSRKQTGLCRCCCCCCYCRAVDKLFSCAHTFTAPVRGGGPADEQCGWPAVAAAPAHRPSRYSPCATGGRFANPDTRPLQFWAPQRQSNGQTMSISMAL